MPSWALGSHTLEKKMPSLLKTLQTKGLFRKIQALVRAAEHLFPKLPGKGSTGPQKRKWVTETVASSIDIRLLSEAQEIALIGLIVDVVVDAWQDAREKWGDAS